MWGQATVNVAHPDPEGTWGLIWLVVTLSGPCQPQLRTSTLPLSATKPSAAAVSSLEFRSCVIWGSSFVGTGGSPPTETIDGSPSTSVPWYRLSGTCASQDAAVLGIQICNTVPIQVRLAIRQAFAAGRRQWRVGIWNVIEDWFRFWSLWPCRSGSGSGLSGWLSTNS